jgi:hypothetical protein
MTLKLCYDAGAIVDADTDRRMCHGYKRGKHRVAWPCYLAVDEFNTVLRVVDWNSKLEVSEVARMSANTFTTVQHGDTRYAPATGACADPVLLCTIIDPQPSFVLRMTFEDDQNKDRDALISRILTERLGEGFVDIMLPAVEDSQVEEVRRAAGTFPSGGTALQQSVVAAVGPAGRLGDNSSSSGSMLNHSPSKSGSCSVSSHTQWLTQHEHQVDMNVQRMLVNLGETFVEDNEDVLEQVVDLLASRVAPREDLLAGSGDGPRSPNGLPDEVTKLLANI